MEIKNFMENFVEDVIEDMVSVEADVCFCEACRLDIAALALNRLPPKYIVTEKGRAFTKVESLKFQFQADVVREVVAAIGKVKERPRHLIRPDNAETTADKD